MSKTYFLIMQHKFSFRLIIGAPKSNASLINGAQNKERGAVYECPVRLDGSTTCNLMAKSDQISMLFYIVDSPLGVTSIFILQCLSIVLNLGGGVDW